MCLCSFSAGRVTCRRCSCEALICPAGKYLHYVPLGTAPGDLEMGIPCSQSSSLILNECVTTRLRVRLDSWALGSGMPFVRDCHTSRSLLVIRTNLKSLFNFRMRKKIIWFQNRLLFYLFLNTKYPSATQMRCFISGEMQHFVQPKMTFSFPSRRVSKPKNR